MTKRASWGLDPVLVLLAVLALWQGVWWVAGDTALASPRDTAARLAVLARLPGFRAEALGTAVSFLQAAVLSVAGGALLGAGLGLNRVAGRVVEPVLTSLYALPKVTLYPVVLLLFGLGASAKVAFGVMHGLIPIVLVTMNAVLQIPRVHLRSARVLRLSQGQVLLHVVWPAIRPEIMAGVRIGVPLSLLGVLIGEMFASRRGLGSIAMRAMDVNDSPTLMAVTVLLSAAALGVNAVLGRLARS